MSLTCVCSLTKEPLDHAWPLNQLFPPKKGTLDHLRCIVVCSWHAIRVFFSPEHVTAMSRRKYFLLLLLLYHNGMTVNVRSTHSRQTSPPVWECSPAQYLNVTTLLFFPGVVRVLSLQVGWKGNLRAGKGRRRGRTNYSKIPSRNQQKLHFKIAHINSNYFTLHVMKVDMCLLLRCIACFFSMQFSWHS